MEIPKYITKKIQQQNKLYQQILELEAQIDNWCDKSGIRTYEDVYKKKIKMVPTEEIHLFQEEELRKYDVSGVKNPRLKSRASDSPSGFFSLATRLHLPFYLLSCFICPMHCLLAVSYSDSLSASLR